MTRHAIMNRLLVIPLILYVTNSIPARVPKIYNALITTDENLQPSQAYPLIEPVLRTTALGVAFPPLLVRPQPPPSQDNQSKPQDQPQPPQLTYHNAPLYPLAYDPYFPLGYRHDLIYPSLPYYQHPSYVDFGHYRNNQGNNPEGGQNPRPSSQEEPKQVQPLPPQIGQLPPQHATNFKKNPDIPDVIPPLPVTRNERG